MENSRFLELREKMTKERFAMCDKKAVGYTEGSDDRHWNFSTIGRELGEPAKKVLGTYLLKHIHSLNHYLATGEQSGEGVAQTIMDIENYLDLLFALIQEESSKCTNLTPESPWNVRVDGCAVYTGPNGRQAVYNKDNELVSDEEDDNASQED